MPQTYVADEVWATLDPRAGLTARNARRWIAMAAVISVLAILAGLLWWSGLVRPRLSTRQSFGWDADMAARRFTYQLALHNDGLFSVDVPTVGRNGPGLTLLAVAGVPATIPPGGEVQIALSYQVTDCGALPSGPWPVPVTARQAVGSGRFYLHQPLITSPDAAAGPRFFSGDDPLGRPWQQALGHLVCAPAKSAGQPSSRP